MKASYIFNRILHSSIFLLLACASVVSASQRVAVSNASTSLTKSVASAQAASFDFKDFGAVGDGVTDDGPALQKALDALAEAGGGTLNVPAGSYVIASPVKKDFTGLASAISIRGVESSDMVDFTDASIYPNELNLIAEFIPKTGEEQNAISLKGLQSLLISDMAFVGTPDTPNDARITLELIDIEVALINHCEFYGLHTWAVHGAVVWAQRTGLRVNQTKFLGSFGASGRTVPVVQTVEWKSINFTDVMFCDFGYRSGFWGKGYLGATFSWIIIGNAAAPTNTSPRREVVLRNVFMDEGAWVELSTLPYQYQPPPAQIDLLYMTGVVISVSNFGQMGTLIDKTQGVFIENSKYQWSHYANSAIAIQNAGNVILDRVACVDSADTIRVDSAVENLTVIDSTYTTLDSQVLNTNVINLQDGEVDKVQYVRQQFGTALGREPDAAAHYYWSNQLLSCGGNASCVEERSAALTAYLNSAPSANFSLTGQALDEKGHPLPNAQITLSGSQSVRTQTDENGYYLFTNLPTSGVYTVTAKKQHYTFNPLNQTIVTPRADQNVNLTATLNHIVISGRVMADSNALSDATVTLNGTQNETTTTDADGHYSFTVVEGDTTNYTVSVARQNYTFNVPSVMFKNPTVDQTLDFTGTLNHYTISGHLLDTDGHVIVDASVEISGAASATVPVDANGFYSFTGLAAGYGYTIIVSSNRYKFAPLAQSINELNANSVADFTGTINRYTISGHLTDTEGKRITDATVALSGSAEGTVTVDANGFYSFPNLPAGYSFTVTPSSSRFKFEPIAKSFVKLNANDIGDFKGTPLYYKIGGRVIDGNNNGVKGVEVELTGFSNAKVTTGVDGRFLFTDVRRDYNYTVKPSLPYYELTPATQSFLNLSADQDISFVMTPILRSIRGRVVADGQGLSGVTMTLSGDKSLVVTTDAEGNYSFLNLKADGSYVVKPSKEHYTFATGELSFTKLDADVTANFSATLNRHKITGKLAKADGSALAGATLTLSGSQTATTKSDSNGNFTFPDLPEGGNYNVTPTLVGYDFTPLAKDLNNLAVDQNVDFIGEPIKYQVKGRVADFSLTPQGIGLSNMTLVISGDVNESIKTDSDGNYLINNLPFGGSFKITVTAAGWTFAPASRSFSTSATSSDFVNRSLTVNFNASPIFEQFSADAFNAYEDTEAFITVTRMGDMSGTSAIDYATSDGSAKAGTDYVATSGTLVFAPGESVKSFTVPLKYDSTVESPETINLNLSSPKGSVERGLTTAVLTINDPKPLLITDSSGMAIALDSVTMTSGPFPLIASRNFSSDNRTRLMLFTRYLDLAAGETASVVKVQAQDSQLKTFDMPVEFVGKVRGFDWLTQINVKLPDGLTPGDVTVQVSLRGISSNPARIQVR